YSSDSEEKNGDPQPIVHEESKRQFIPIHKRDTDHKPAAEAEVPSMTSDIEQQPKSPFDGVKEESEVAKLRSVRRVGKKKVTSRPSRA
ncbi:hypothetical protein PENTCL1PPCAC_23031, partial [Pristionchus entomophagus]